MPSITTDLNLAINTLRQGHLLAIPTETVYGLAALVNDDEAIKSVFATKGRPLNHPLIVHVGLDWDLSPWVKEVPEYAKALMKAFWPGPLTLVLPCNLSNLSPLVTGGQSSVAIRCPSHPQTLELLNQLGMPLVAPSANPFGKISPTTALHVKNSFPEKELTILDGGRCTVGIESTIVDATNHAGYKILRHGLITELEIAQVIVTPCLDEDSTLRVPGRLDSHYQPQKSLFYFEHYEDLESFCQNQHTTVYVIAPKKPTGVADNLFHPFSTQPNQAAFELYYQLREADESEAHCIAIQLPKATRAWQGVRERILKAGVSI